MSPHPIPANGLHAHYAKTGGHADCYSAIIPRHARDKRSGVSLADFVCAFYTSPLFRIERWIIAVARGRPSTDAEARVVALGETPFNRPGAGGQFAAWTVEARSENQLVMCDYQGRTRSWFMVEEIENGPSTSSGRAEIGTRIYFGTAIARSRGAVGMTLLHPFPKRARRAIPFAFRALMPLHRFYSRALLWSAVRQLRTR